jgi:hypothetical protein
MVGGINVGSASGSTWHIEIDGIMFVNTWLILSFISLVPLKLQKKRCQIKEKYYPIPDSFQDPYDDFFIIEFGLGFEIDKNRRFGFGFGIPLGSTTNVFAFTNAWSGFD